jgi:hypothetical protein
MPPKIAAGAPSPMSAANIKSVSRTAFATIRFIPGLPTIVTGTRAGRRASTGPRPAFATSCSSPTPGT